MPYEPLNPNPVNLEHMVKCMDMAFDACNKPRSSDEMPETDEERADRKHRESGQDRNLPQ